MSIMKYSLDLRRIRRGCNRRWVWFRWFQIGLGRQIELPSSAEVSLGEVESSFQLATARVCGATGSLCFCATLSAGAMQAEGRGLRDATASTTPHVAIGAQVGVVIPIGERFEIELDAAVSMPVTRTTLRISDEQVWQSPPIGASLSALWVIVF